MVLFALYSNIYAQVNMVKNGGFEQYSRCPIAINQIKYANFWQDIDSVPNPDYGLPWCASEYCNTCDTLFYSLVKIPRGGWYYHYPRSGNGMAHSTMYFDNSYSPEPCQRDYLQGHLRTNLSEGISYCVTFYVTLDQGSKYAINHIGAYFDNGSIDAGRDSLNCGFPISTVAPQVVEDSIINDTLNWVKVQGSFTAVGNETFINIGTFYDIHHIDTITRIINYPWDSSAVAWAYYLIDDVSVIESGTVADAGVNGFVSPGSDSAFIGIPDEGLPTTWYVVGNTIPICYGSGGFKVHPDTTTKYVVVLDLCGHVTTDTVTVFVGSVGIRSTLNGALGELVKIYPNPATKQITVEGVENCEIIVFDILGSDKIRLKSEKFKDVIDIGNLVNGIYFVTVVSLETGERVVKKVVKE